MHGTLSRTKSAEAVRYAGQSVEKKVSKESKARRQGNHLNDHFGIDLSASASSSSISSQR